MRKTLKWLQQKFYWLGCWLYMELCVHCCDLCTAKKGQLQPLHALLKSALVPLMERVAVDVLGPFPTTEDKKHYMLMVMNYFTKWPN